MRHLIPGLVLAFLTIPCFAADSSILPDKPQPQAKVFHKATADREFWMEAGAVGAAWTVDAISTSSRFHWCEQHYGTFVTNQADCSEGGGLFNGSRSVPKVMGAWAAVDVGAAVASYEWKKHVRNRYLHPFWRVPLIVQGESHTQAAIQNWAYPRRETKFGKL